MLLNIAKVISLTTLSKSTIYRLIDAGKFPKPVQISSRRVGWREEDIDIYLAALATRGAAV